jgi:hypothetical protein
MSELSLHESHTLALLEGLMANEITSVRKSCQHLQTRMGRHACVLAFGTLSLTRPVQR